MHDPQSGFNTQARIAASLARMLRSSTAKGFNNRSMGIGQYPSDQGCSPLFATLNQKSRQLGILNVNKP
ncbi:hypothetical protein RLO149_p630280 (plasmid) [Roseobacter litoralis Och 149]|uniref:Uncharacterized protein n=1 Tax=Roseobacter litoralis (strain ATCC 49566 / DSM 6996 / JCM 21268 / NBRC 15278 / OCh 149) TaxID=391595 RepID=F7ZMK5_ROSLO|nr:hypothetical protein RLO149_p630280 [Roseobacter litoralis Och 149]